MTERLTPMGIAAFEGCAECGEAAELWGLLGTSDLADKIIGCEGFCSECTEAEDIMVFHATRLLAEISAETQEVA